MTKDTGQGSGQVKTCTKCGETKDNGEFGRNKGGKFGTRGICKECTREYHRRLRIEHPEKTRGASKKYKAANKEKVAEAGRAYYQANKVKAKESRAKRYQDNKEHELERNRRWSKANYEKVLEIGKRYDAKRRSTPKGRLDNAISAGIHRGLKRGSKSGRHTFSLLGYSIDELVSHLERQFQPGMTWENYGKKGWEVDHILPRSVFNYETPDDIDFKRCWSLDNLQPLWGPENWSKGGSIYCAFQPALALAMPAANDNAPVLTDDDYAAVDYL